MPGSAAKLDVLADRAAAREGLHHDQDPIDWNGVVAGEVRLLAELGLLPQRPAAAAA